MAGRFFPVQIMSLGQTGSIASLNVASLGNDGSSPFLGQLGMVIEDSGKVYRLVQHVKVTASVTTAAGFACHWYDRDNFKVVSDQTDAQAGVNGVAGAYLGVVTDNYYCFIQMGGKQTLKTAASVVAGDKLIGSTTDGQLARVAAGTATTDECVAIAYGSVSSGFSAAYWKFGAGGCGF